MLLGEVENSPKYINIHFKRSALSLFLEFYDAIFFIHVEFGIHCVYIQDGEILEGLIFITIQS